MSEADFQKAVTDLLDLMRIRWHHEVDSRKSKRGFPDLVIVLPRGVIYRELKTEKGRVRPEQAKWLADLTAAGEDADIWRPSDLTSGRIQKELGR